MAEIYPKSEVDSIPPLSPYKALAMVRDLTGTVVHLRELEEVVKVVIEDDRAAVLISTAKYTETSTKYTIKARGRRMIQLNRERARWRREEMTFWTDESVDEIIHKHATALSTREAIEKARWERDCGRPGTSRFPLDSAEAADSPRMYRHWGLGVES